MGNQFAEWLQGQIDLRGWTQSELARRAGVTPPTINRILSQERLPGVDLCRGIARAFGISEIGVLRMAGLATDKPIVDEQGENLLVEFYRLSDEDRQFVLDQIRGLRRIREEQGNYEAHP